METVIMNVTNSPMEESDVVVETDIGFWKMEGLAKISMNVREITEVVIKSVSIQRAVMNALATQDSY